MFRIFISLFIGLFICFTGKAQFSSHNNIKFHFWSVPSEIYKDEIKIFCSLYNPNSDTIYFASTSCQGMQYSLEFDTVKFNLRPSILCNISLPVIESIPPYSRIDFYTFFKNLKGSKNIKLGFDFFEVEKTFFIENPRLRIHYRDKKDKNIIWADIHQLL